MFLPKGTDITKNFIVHGVKVIGDYTYVLKIDIEGQTIIQQIKSDDTTILFCAKPDGMSIVNFWADPTASGLVYSYYHLT